MNLPQLFKKLSVGVLRELSIAGEGTGIVPIGNQPKLLAAANEGLSAIYARFPLAERTLVLETYAGIYEYKLHPDFALSSASAEPIKYIVDNMGQVFDGNVLMITDVYDSAHHWLPLNDRNNIKSWHTKGNTGLVMDYPVTGERYFVGYRKAHPELPTDADELEQLTLEDIEIVLPRELEPALMHFIASDIYGGMSMESSMAKSNKHLERYEAVCTFHELNNTFNGSVAETNMKPDLGGWTK